LGLHAPEADLAVVKGDFIWRVVSGRGEVGTVGSGELPALMPFAGGGIEALFSACMVGIAAVWAS
jgi:hypothetical protein